MLKKILKPFLYVVFTYLVLMMVVLGNGSSFLGRYMGSYFVSAANLIGLNTTWNFFSPDPAHVLYLKYIVHYEDEYGNPTQEPVSSYFPPEEDNTNFSLHKRRLSYVMRFLASSQKRIEEFFIPWICKKYPGATKIQTEIEFHRIPDLDVASTMSGADYEELVKQEEINPYVYKCP